MDTGTVLEIIALIDTRIIDINNKLMDKSDIFFSGKLEAYEELGYHLQCYIESQLNAAENQTGE